jgi:hypothetical protein
VRNLWGITVLFFGGEHEGSRVCVRVRRVLSAVL